MFSGFQSNAFQNNAFQIATPGITPDDNGWLGGTFNDPYSYADRGRQARKVWEAQEEIIRLKKEAQDLRLQELSYEREQDKQTQRQLRALAREKANLQLLIAKETQKLAALQQTLEQRNFEAMLVLSMSCPFINFGR